MASAWVALLSALVVFGYHQVKCSCNNLTTFSMQLDTLLAEYDRELLPSTPTRVQTVMHLRHATIYDKSATMRLLADLSLKWEDKRLSWNATDWGCEKALTSSSRLWLPDVSILSTALLGPDGDTELRAMLSSDGQVSWIIRFDIEMPINLQLLTWPNDIQKAILKFGSRSHSEDIDIKIGNFTYTVVFESGAWELVSHRGYEATMESSAGGSLPTVEWEVTLRRRAAAHALAVSTVMVTAAVLLSAAMLLPHAIRPPLCAAAAATASLWLISSLSRVPGATSAPLASSLMAVVGVSCAAAGACAALVLRVARCTRPPPRALRALVTTASAVVTLAPPEGSETECSAWAAAAQLLDYVLIAVLLFIVFISLCIYI